VPFRGGLTHRLFGLGVGVALALCGIVLSSTPVRAAILEATWTAPTTNVDGSSLTDLAGYRIYYGPSPAPCPGSAFFEAAAPAPLPAPGETVRFTLTGLATDTLYYVSVVAVDASGNVSDCSDPAPAAVARADVSVSPSGTLSFGSVAPGAFVDKSFTVQNSGGGTVAVTVSTSAPFTIVSGSAFELAGGATQTVAVRFAPTAAATVTGNVNFTTSSGTISRIVTGSSDTTQLAVAITSPTAGPSYSTTTSSLTLGGTASGGSGISEVTWSNNRGGSGTAAGTTSWTASGITVQPGANLLTVTARDSAGNTAVTTLSVTFSDTTSPTIAISSPSAGATYTTRTSPLSLAGTARDDTAVARVTWSNSQGGSGTATGTATWTATGVVLQPGSNVLTVTAQDAAGNTGTATMTVVYDPTPPTVVITMPTGAATYLSPTAIVTLGGTASDNVAPTQVTWSNSRGGSGTAAGTTSWTVGAITLKSGTNVLKVTARDAAGNTGTATLTVTLDSTPPAVAITTPTTASTYDTASPTLTLAGTASDNVGVARILWANNQGGSGTASGTANWTASGIALQPGANVVTITAQDILGNTNTASMTVNFDPTPPVIAITSPVLDSTSPSVDLTGTASDNRAVTQVTWTNSRGGTGIASGTTSWSASRIVLQPGQNVLTATARDAAGNSTAASVTVTFTDITPPTVAVTAPAAGATVGGMVTVSAGSIDDVQVAAVQFAVDGVNLGSELTTAPYAVAWNTMTAVDGNHTLTAVARDGAGNVTTSAPISVVVSNTAGPAPLLFNGSFETFSGTLATGWSLVTDGVVGSVAAADTGVTGLAQKMTITSPGGWGLYLYQRPPLELNKTYEWTVWYKTSGATAIWAQITDAPVSQVVLSQALPGTNGVWKQQTLTFTYTNALADQLRISSNAAGTFWVDELTLREATAPPSLLTNGNFEAFTGSVATGWTVATDGVVAAVAAADSGTSGLAQKMTISSPGAWGLYVYQRPPLQLGTTYEWTVWYKTSGGNAIWAQITDAAFSQVVLSQALPGTNGAWKQQTLTFAYDNALADLLRISSNAAGSFWLDELTLREATAPPSLLTNGSFETFTSTVATGWTLTTDRAVGAVVAADTGARGLAQKVTITTAGAWGLYLHQRPALQVNKTYEWTVWYKTSGANAIWAQITDAPVSQVVLSQALPGTNGVWKQQTLTFTYTNVLADQLRISSNAVGSFWLDEFVLREVP
jgi:hypothetical protein